ncbi:MAG TPA: hypothetical protein VFY29_17060 [Terriglobia bacterium]|nr:hypothetical protein [Terriglobia bacterium]
MITRVDVDGVGLVAEGAMAPYLELDESDIQDIWQWKRPTVVIDIAPWSGAGVPAAEKYRRLYCDSTTQWNAWQRNEERRTAKRCGVVHRAVQTGTLERLFDAAMEERCSGYFSWADIDDAERTMFRRLCAGYPAMTVSLKDEAGALLSESLLVHVERLHEWYLVFTSWLRDDPAARRMMVGVRALFECARVTCDELGTRLNVGPAMGYKSAVATSSEPALGIVLCDDDTEGEWTDYVPKERWNRCR